MSGPQVVAYLLFWASGLLVGFAGGALCVVSRRPGANGAHLTSNRQH